jgi:hypothetical protein
MVESAAVLCVSKRGAKAKYLPAILEVLNEQKGVLTDRQIFYRLVSKGFFSNALTHYVQLCKVIKQGRINGLIPWDRIEDRSKPIYEVEERSDGMPDSYFLYHKERYEDAERVFRDSYQSYYVPLWSFQPEYIEVWCEKDALAGVLRQVTEKWMIPLVVCRGYQSISNIYSRVQTYRVKANNGKKIRILYFGDYDPRGQNIPEVISRDFESLGFPIELNKIALTKEQISEFNLIPAPCKKTDSMAKNWILNHGDAVYELDAIEPNTLLSIVENAVKSHFSIEKYQRREQFIKDGKEELRKLISEYFGETENDSEGDSNGS